MTPDPDLYGPPERGNEDPQQDDDAELFFDAAREHDEALDLDREIKRLHCERCDSARFAVYYDPIAQGSHVECEACGEICHV